MKYMVFILTLLLISGVGYAQIDQHMDYDETKEKMANIELPWDRFYWGSFDIEELPGPLKPVKVNFTLELAREDLSDDEWVIKLYFSDNVVKITGDTLFYWPGPHKLGDKFSNSFEMTPLMSGKWSIALTRMFKNKTHNLPPELVDNGILFTWCIDAEGELQYLGPNEWKQGVCTMTSTKFFTQDSVLLDLYPGARNIWLYDYTITFKPTPRIGDTSEVHFHLMANNGSPENCNITLEARYVNAIGEPQMIRDEYLGKEIVDIKFKFIPLAVNDLHAMNISITKCPLASDGKSPGQSIGCMFLFSEDGTLHYITEGKSGIGTIPEDAYPKSFPDKTSYTSKERRKLFYLNIKK